GELLKDGTKPTYEWFEKNAASRWGMPLNAQNISVHWKKHFRPNNPEGIPTGGAGTSIETAARQDVRSRMLDYLDKNGLEKVAVESEAVQDSGGGVGRGEGASGDAAVGAGDTPTGDVSSDQESPVPGLRLSDPGRGGVPALLPGDQGAAASPDDVQRRDLPRE